MRDWLQRGDFVPAACKHHTKDVPVTPGRLGLGTDDTTDGSEGVAAPLVVQCPDPSNCTKALKTDDLRVVSPTCRNASDCTEELQGALDGCASHMVLNPLPGGRAWITQPLFVRNCPQPQLMELKPGVVLEAIKGGFHGNGDTLLRVSNVTGFKLHGPGATLRMHRSDYSHSEGRMAIALRGAEFPCVPSSESDAPPVNLTRLSHVTVSAAAGSPGVTDVEISGAPGLPLTVRESGGDGCYIAHLFGSTPAQNSRNVAIHNVNFTENYRQGISVIGVVGLNVTDTELSYTRGTPPMAGVDFEPDVESNELS